MTRKSKKGTIGKETQTLHRRYEAGPGIDFVNKGLKNTDEIEKEVRKELNKQS